MSADGDPAISVIQGGGGPLWKEAVRGQPTGSYRNAQEALRCLGAEFSFNEFRQRAYVQWHLFGPAPVELGDRHLARLRKAIASRYEFDPTDRHLEAAARALCEDRITDPRKAYFDGLVWDKRPRLDAWLCRYMGAEDTPLAREFGRKTLIAGVRRVRQPGCKFDTILVLEGDQGKGKSTALSILAGDPEYFTDQDIIHLTAKEQQEAIAGKHIIEMAELAGLKRTDSERVKAFASRQVDRCRGAWQRFTIDQPRRCIMVATTNSEDYLVDTTGNRRFWPVRTGAIDLEGLRDDVDQIWAEAALAERSGEALFLDRELWTDAAHEQDERLERHPWDDILSSLGSSYALRHGDSERALTSDLLTGKLNIPTAHLTRGHYLQLSRSMKRLGWRGPMDIRAGGKVVKGYERTFNEINDVAQIALEADKF